MSSAIVSIMRPVTYLKDYSLIEKTFSFCERPVSFEYKVPFRIKIDNLITRKLTGPIDITVVLDGDDYIAECPDLPLYGYGENKDEAIEMLKREIESLYDDLMRDTDFSSNWDQIREYLKEKVAG